MQSQEREIVSDVYAFMNREAELGLQIPIRKFGKRTKTAPGVSERTVRNIIAERRNIKQS